MSDASGSSDDDGDYAFGDSHMAESKRFPIHDCCEFEDAETLRVSGVADPLPLVVHTSTVNSLERALLCFGQRTDGEVLDLHDLTISFLLLHDYSRN